MLKRLALTSIGLFFTQIPISPEGLKISILQVVFDMIMVHEHDLLRDGSVSSLPLADYQLI
jgi:condensin complex subunit 3